MAKRKASEIKIIGNGAAEVALTQGKVAIIDVEDIPVVAPYKWHAVEGTKNVWYARHSPAKKPALHMHRLIFGELPSDAQVDHIDQNGLNNRRSNLRLANATVQKLNQTTRKDNTSGCNGVHIRPNGKWQARISVQGKRVSLGHFATYQDAVYCMESVRKIVDELLGMITTAESNRKAS